MTMLEYGMRDLPDKSIKTMEKFEETFLNRWSLHKMFPALDIQNVPGYLNHFSGDWVKNCPNLMETHPWRSLML
jgi:hypothetical protein